MNLENIPKKNCFKVPENYFENTENEIMQKVIEKPGKCKCSCDIFKPYIYLVACVIALVCMVKFAISVAEPCDSDGKQQEISADITISEPTKTSEKRAMTEAYSAGEGNTGLPLDYVIEYLADYYIEYEF